MTQDLLAGRPELLVFEPGRFLVGNAGILLTRVEYLKLGAERNFAVVDAGMNDLVRPSHYQAYHEIVEVEEQSRPPRRADVVGPVCETGDFLALDRMLPAVESGEMLAVLGAAAEGTDLVFVAGMINKLIGVIMASPRIKTPSDLKGKVIAVTSMSGGSWMFTTLALEYWGLDAKRDGISFRVLGDEAVQESVVEQCQRDARDEHGGGGVRGTAKR